jgi:hypothetical protein
MSENLMKLRVSGRDEWVWTKKNTLKQRDHLSILGL